MNPRNYSHTQARAKTQAHPGAQLSARARPKPLPLPPTTEAYAEARLVNLLDSASRSRRVSDCRLLSGGLLPDVLLKEEADEEDEVDGDEEVGHHVLEDVLLRVKGEGRAVDADEVPEEGRRAELKDLGKGDKGTENHGETEAEVVVHEGVDEAVHEEATLLSAGLVHDMEEEEDGGGMVVDVEETDLLHALALPNEDGGVKPLPNLRNGEGDGDKAEPVRERSAEEGGKVGKLALRVEVVGAGTKNKGGVKEQPTKVPEGDAGDGLLRGVEAREDEVDEEQVESSGAESREEREGGKPLDLGVKVRDVRSERPLEEHPLGRFRKGRRHVYSERGNGRR